MTAVIAGLRCERCGGHSVRPVDPETGLRDDEVHACPHCLGSGVDAEEYTIGRMYRVTGYQPTEDFVDEVDRLESFDVDLGDLTETQYRDFVAVRAEGESYADRARERGVARSTVRTNVLRAADKLES